MKLPLDPLSLVPALTWVYGRWWRTFRFSCPEQALFTGLLQGGGPMVMAIWHEELFPLISWGLHLGLPMGTIVSDSKDGEIITRMLERVGFGTARGSSTRGGLKALVGGIRLLRDQGSNLAVTVDGPRGPRGQVKEGVVFAALKSGAPIVPVRAHADWKHVFRKSWDRFQLPLPFTRIQVRAGTPYHPEPDADGGLSRESMARETARLQSLLQSLGPTPRQGDAP